MKLKSLIKNIYLGIGYSCSNLFLRLSYSLYKRMSGHAVGTICSYLSRGTVSKYKDYRFIKLDIEKGIAMALLKHVGMSRGDMARLIKSVDNQNIKENR